MYRLGSRVSINLGLSQAIHPKNKNRAYSRHSGCQTRYRPSRHAFSSSYLGRSWGNILSKFCFSKWSYWPKNGLNKFFTAKQSKQNFSFSSAKATLQSQMSVCLSIPFEAKPLSLLSLYLLQAYLISDLSNLWYLRSIRDLSCKICSLRFSVSLATLSISSCLILAKQRKLLNSEKLM